MVFSIAWLDFSTPYFDCSAFTASGFSLAESRIGSVAELVLGPGQGLVDDRLAAAMASVSR